MMSVTREVCEEKLSRTVGLREHSLNRSSRSSTNIGASHLLVVHGSFPSFSVYRHNAAY